MLDMAGIKIVYAKRPWQLDITNFKVHHSTQTLQLRGRDMISELHV